MICPTGGDRLTLLLLAMPAVVVLAACAPKQADRPVTQGYSLARAFLLGETGRQAHDWRQQWAVDGMAEAGFEYRPEPFNENSIATVGAGASLEIRERFGYGISMEIPTPEAHVDNEVIIDDDELPAYRTVLEECLSSADAEVERRRFELGDAISSADRAFIDEAFSGGNEQVTAAIDAWAECMSERGWEFTLPENALSTVQQDWEDLQHPTPDDAAIEAFRERERLIAVADFDCSQDTIRVAERDFFHDLDERLAGYDIDIYT